MIKAKILHDMGPTSYEFQGTTVRSRMYAVLEREFETESELLMFKLSQPDGISVEVIGDASTESRDGRGSE